jgi:hypothetical protein
MPLQQVNTNFKLVVWGEGGGKIAALEIAVPVQLKK